MVQKRSPPKLLHVCPIGVSETLERVCTPLGVKIVFKAQRIVKDMLMKVKQKVPMGRRERSSTRYPAQTAP